MIQIKDLNRVKPLKVVGNAQIVKQKSLSFLLRQLKTGLSIAGNVGEKESQKEILTGS